MSDEAIDRLLRSLAGVCQQARADQVEAERVRKDLSADDDEHAVSHLRVDPQRALINQRTLLAENIADEQERIAQRLIAWWVDVAICTTASVASGRPLTVARAVAAHPSLCMEAEDLAFLPPIEDRQLAALSVELDEALSAGQRLSFTPRSTTPCCPRVPGRPRCSPGEISNGFA
ncbi:hypothetical protein [Nonomuraea sp. KM90]|uniref:hypothetical protein n=1 Tax=Nonomuraea sp. KM90 TaxID=3457428 RepID=UPI003FCDBB98